MFVYLCKLIYTKWLFHPTDGYIFPWAALHFSLALLSYLFLLPSYETLSTLSINWIGIIFIRNFIFVLIYSSAWHYYLHVYRFQKDQYRFNLRPLGKGKNWLFGSLQLHLAPHHSNSHILSVTYRHGQYPRGFASTHWSPFFWQLRLTLPPGSEFFCQLC